MDETHSKTRPKIMQIRVDHLRLWEELLREALKKEVPYSNSQLKMANCTIEKLETVMRTVWSEIQGVCAGRVDPMEFYHTPQTPKKDSNNPVG